jgi:enolase-phosphatase E1
MAERRPRAILLDIEGTTTPVAFVYEVLFPFARLHVGEFIRRHQLTAEVRADIEALRAEHRADTEAGREPPAWREDSADAQIESATRYVHWLMDQDRKSTALKSLQGKVWESGYLGGLLRGQVYEDVPPAFERWRGQRRSIHIFSSGSVLAQKLLFAHTTAGDLTAYLGGYFDTNTGAKTDPASYHSISAATGTDASGVLFVSDVTAELDAARDAGMLTALCVRPGSPEPEPRGHTVIHTFDALFPAETDGADGRAA